MILDNERHQLQLNEALNVQSDSEACCFPLVNTKCQVVVRLKVSRKEAGLGAQLRTPCGQVVLKEEQYPAGSIGRLVNFPGGNWTCFPSAT